MKMLVSSFMDAMVKLGDKNINLKKIETHLDEFLFFLGLVK